MPKIPNILEGESLEEFNALSESLHAQFQPASEIERSLVDMMIHHQWFMRRALGMQQALKVAAGDSEADAKRLNLVVRYHKTHERAYTQTKRQLEDLRKHKRRMDTLTDREAAATRNRQRQWEQILKKMPTLTDWVN